MGLFGFFSSKNKETLDKGLEKTKESVFGKLARIVAGKSTVDDDGLLLLRTPISDVRFRFYYDRLSLSFRQIHGNTLQDGSKR